MQLLNVTFCTMLFAGGMPALYLVTAINFAISYWVEKVELLKVSRMPPQYTAHLARFAGWHCDWPST